MAGEETFDLEITADSWRRARVEAALRGRTPSWPEEDRAAVMAALFEPMTAVMPRDPNGQPSRRHDKVASTLRGKPRCNSPTSTR